MKGTPFYYNQFGTYIVQAADVANGYVSFPALPVPEDLSNAPYFYVWGVNMAAWNPTPVAVPFEQHRFLMAGPLIDGTDYTSGLFYTPSQFQGSQNFYNYYRMKLELNTSFLYQVLLTIGGLAGIVAGDQIVYQNSLIVTYDAPEGNFGSPGQRQYKESESIHPGTKELKLRPGAFRFDH